MAVPKGSIEGLFDIFGRPTGVAPNRVYQPQPQPMGPYGPEEGNLLSRYRRAEADPANTRTPREAFKPEYKPVGPAYSGEPNIYSKIAGGIRGVGDAVDSGQTKVVDEIADITGLNKFQNSLLDGSRDPSGVGADPQAGLLGKASDLQEIVPQGEKKVNKPKTETDKLTPNSTIKEASEAALADHKAEREQMNTAIATKTREDLKAKGADEEALKGWDKFVDDYDLGMVGMALLASNDGTGNIWSNLGLALMEGKKSRTEEKDKISATKQQELENELALLKEGREQANVGSQIERRTSQNATDAAGVNIDAAGLPIRQQGADAAMLSAQASMIRAMNSGQGPGSAADKAASASARNAAGAYLANNPRYDWGKLTEGQRGNITSKTGDNYKELIAAAEAAGEGYDPADVMSVAADMAAEESDLKLGKDGFFGLYGDPVYGR